MTYNTHVSAKQMQHPSNRKPLPKIPETRSKNVQGRVYQVGIATEQDQKDTVDLLTKYFETGLKLNKLEQELAEKEKVVKGYREHVLKLLAQNVLKTSIKTLSDFALAKLGLITFDIDNDGYEYLITSEKGIEEVIIPLVKKFSIKEVNFSIFKDKLNGKAFEIFLGVIAETNETNETNVKKITISEAKMAILTRDEKVLIKHLSQKLHVEFEFVPLPSS